MYSWTFTFHKVVRRAVVIPYVWFPLRAWMVYPGIHNSEIIIKTGLYLPNETSGGEWPSSARTGRGKGQRPIHPLEHTPSGKILQRHIFVWSEAAAPAPLRRGLFPGLNSIGGWLDEPGTCRLRVRVGSWLNRVRDRPGAASSLMD